MITTLVLSLPIDREKFLVYCDVSRQGLGSVPMQMGKVIAYASRQLKDMTRAGIDLLVVQLANITL